MDADLVIALVAGAAALGGSAIASLFGPVLLARLERRQRREDLREDEFRASAIHMATVLTEAVTMLLGVSKSRDPGVLARVSEAQVRMSGWAKGRTERILTTTSMKVIVRGEPAAEKAENLLSRLSAWSTLCDEYFQDPGQKPEQLAAKWVELVPPKLPTE